MNTPDPWKDPKTFVKVFKKVAKESPTRVWVGMASYFTTQGNPVSETTIRRAAAKHEVTLQDAHSPETSKVASVAEKARAVTRQAKDAAQEARAQARDIEKDAARRVKELEREFAQQLKAASKEAKEQALAEAREATPKELADYEKRIIKSEQKANKYRQIASHLAREDNIIGELEKRIQPYLENLVLPQVETPTHLQGISEDPISLLLSLNDIHWGEQIEPERVNNLNAYSPNIAARRLQHIVDTTRVWAENYRRIGEVDELVVLLNGDNFSGMHNIHPDEANEYARIATQAMDSALVIAQAIWELSHDFPKVRIIAPAGDNHTRSTRRNATSAVAIETSWSSVHHEMIASLLGHTDHISFNIAPSYQVFFDIKGFSWAACHGHSLKGGGGQLGIPAYALKRLYEASVQKSVTLAKNQMGATSDEIAALLRGVVDHVVLGHFHQQFYAQFNGGDVRITPSLKGADTFSLDILGKYNPAAQSLFAIHPDHDVIADHTINVQHIAEEGHTRYKWGALTGGETASQIFKEWREDFDEV
jgi:hypothetical protein